MIHSTRTLTNELRAPELPSGDEARRLLIAPLPVKERRLVVDGLATTVLEGGNGPPMLLLHGPGEHVPKWCRVIPNLARDHKVVVPDLPGHGSSEPLGDDPPIEGVLRWLEDLVRQTCPTPPILVGQILGGGIAARFAIAHPDRVASLVLVDSLGLAPFRPAPEFGKALHEFLADPDEETHERLWSQCAFDLPALQDELGPRWQWLARYNLDRAGRPELRAEQGRLMEAFGLPAIPAHDLERIAVPTMLIWGRHDLATSLQVAEEARERFGWPLHVVEDAADDPPLERPERFLEALRAALDEVGSVAPDPRRDHPPEAWGAIATGYDRTVTPSHMAVAREGLRRAGVGPTTRFLDVAAGSGALALPAARLGASVVAIDLSSAMLERLEARARQEGLEIETRGMNGEDLELDDDSFDVAGSQFGVMLFRDMRRALREMARVVRPGGRVLVNAYGDPDEIEFLDFLVRAVRPVRPEFEGPPTDPPPLEFQLSDPETLRAVLRASGLRDVSVETVTETTEYESGEALWDWIVSSNPIVEKILGGMLGLAPEERLTVRGNLETLVRERMAGRDRARLNAPVNIGVGTR